MAVRDNSTEESRKAEVCLKRPATSIFLLRAVPTSCVVFHMPIGPQALRRSTKPVIPVFEGEVKGEIGGGKNGVDCWRSRI